MGSERECRSAVATATAPPVAGRVVLLEAPEGAAAAELWRTLEEKGAHVVWCPGPEGPSPAWCPLMAGRRCSLVEAADVVVFALGCDGASCRLVRSELERLHPETPVIETV